MRYDLNLLPVFVALMEERSVTRAAQRLGMTQPSLSNALGRLRALMQDQLFVRERHGIQPTPIALALAPRIAAAVEELNSTVVSQQEFDPTRAERSFSIAVTGYVEYVLIPPLVARLSEVAPGVELRLLPYGNELGETGVMSGTTALVLGRIVDPPDNLVVQHLMTDGLACVVRSDHPEVADGMSKEQYEGMKHVNILPPGRLRTGVFKALERQGLKRQVVTSVMSFLVVPEIIAMTDYCATLPSLICRRLAQDPRMKIVPTPVELDRFPVEIAWHVRYRDDPAHRWLRTLIGKIAVELQRES